MLKNKYRAKWKKSIEDDQQSFKALLESDPFEQWEKNRMPETSAEEELFLGLDLLYANSRDLRATRFFKRCLEVCDRTLKEDKLSSELCRRYFPLNRAQLTRAMCYARACLGNTLDGRLLLSASHDFNLVAKNSSDWDDQIEAYYLDSVRLALIGRDFVFAQALLNPMRDIIFHKEQYMVLIALVECAANERIPGRDVKNHFDTFFDVIRDPDFRPTIFTEIGVLRLELSALRERYFGQQSGPEINWQKVIDDISK